MKKIIISIFTLVSLTFVLTSCGKFTCDLCDEEKRGKKHEEEVFGESVVICDDCYEDLEDLGDALDDGWDDLKNLFN